MRIRACKHGRSNMNQIKSIIFNYQEVDATCHKVKYNSISFIPPQNILDKFENVLCCSKKLQINEAMVPDLYSWRVELSIHLSMAIILSVK